MDKNFIIKFKDGTIDYGSLCKDSGTNQTYKIIVNKVYKYKGNKLIISKNDFHVTHFIDIDNKIIPLDQFVDVIIPLFKNNTEFEKIKSNLDFEKFLESDLIFQAFEYKDIYYEDYRDIKVEYFKKYIKLSLEVFNFERADKIFENQGIECLTKNEYKDIKEKYVSKYNKKNLLIKNIKGLFSNYNFIGADNLFQNQEIECINLDEYKNIKSQYMDKYIKYILNEFGEKEADRIFELHLLGIGCLSKDIYLITKNNYILEQNEHKKKEYKDLLIKNINGLLSSYNFIGADNLFQNQEIIDLDEYKDIKSPYIHKQIKSFLELFDFVKADKIFENQGIECINLDEYKDIKSPYIYKYIKSFLELFDFVKADKIFENQGIECINLDEYNNKKKEYIKLYFEDPNCTKLNDEKYKILADMSRYTLIKARAGTGKTTFLKYKIKLLTEKYGVDSNEILAFSFNKKAASELMKKTQEVGVRNFCSSMTFHSFAGKILSKTVNEKYELLFDDNKSKDQDKALSNFTQQIIKEYIENDWDNHKSKLYNFFRKEIEELGESILRNRKEDIYDYYRANEKSEVCLNGVRVKSIAEKWISDFLFEHNIDFKYEHPASHKLLKDRNGIRRQIRPDFTITSLQKSWIENNAIIQKNNQQKYSDPFAIMQSPRFEKWKVLIEFWGRPSEVQYKNNMIRKEQYYKEKRLYLIDFKINEINYKAIDRRELFEYIIKQRLESHGIICEKLSNEKLFAKCKIKFINEFTKKITSFAQKAKQNKFSYENLEIEYKKNKNLYSEKQCTFYDYAIEILKRYELKLTLTKQKDFNDLLEQCGDTLSLLSKKSEDIQFKIGKNPINNQDQFQYIKNIKYILVDEYQDFSLLFYDLLNGIRLINPNVYIINVGDDWQLINTFAGSKITYIEEYEKYFEGGKIYDLLETNRSPEKIISFSNDFMIGFGKGAKGKSGNKLGEIVGYISEDMEIKEDWHDFDGKRKNIMYATDIDTAKLFGIHYKNFEIIEVLKNNKKEKIIIVPKENSEYAQLIRTLYNIFIKDKNYSNSFDINSDNHDIKKKISDVMILHRSNKLFYGVDHRENGKSEFTTFDIQNHLIDLLYISIIEKLKIEKPDIRKKIKNNLEKIISVKTIHQSKGLEADTIIILGIGEEGLYPMLHPDNELNAIFGETIEDAKDEERRLFYVALTRTKNKLYYISEKEIPAGKNHGDFLIESWGNS